VKPHIKNKAKKKRKRKSWGRGSSGRAPAQQVQGLEFKLQYHKKKNFLKFKFIL
jgi:hypothetical protein